MIDMEEILPRLRREFLDEATHLLDDCEEIFLHLAEPGTRAKNLAQIFRALHTIKGSGAAVGLTDVVTFAHVVEDCLSSLRERPDCLTDDLTTLLLQSCDALRTRLDALKADRSSEPWDVEVLTAALNAATGGLKGGPAAPPADAPAFGFFDDPPPSPSVSTPRGSQTHPTRKVASASVKIESSRIEGVLDLVGEIVVIKSQLITKAEKYKEDPELTGIIALLEKTVRELQDRTLTMRMTPLKPLFVKMERLVRDLAPRIGKELDFTVFGEDTEIDRNMVEVLADPLLHLIRNAMDHGIEAKEGRAEAGKPARGQLRLAACQRGSAIEIRVVDDGRGIDRDRVLRKASERGLVPVGVHPDQLSDREVFEFIMQPGFSTADRVSDLSGRGVGLDVVKTNVERLRGQVSIESKVGQGTTFILSIPLSASITDGMIVQVNGFPYVMPMDRIRELVKVTPNDVTVLSKEHSTVRVRERILPWLDLRALAAKHHDRSVEHATEVAGLFVVVEHAERRLAVRVDEVIGQMQVVMKPLCDNLEHAAGVTGAAVLGDGRVALILDTEGLCRDATKQAA